MKRWMPAALASLVLCVGFWLALTVYLRPLSGGAYNLSLAWEGEAMPEGWVYDQKGWTVFTQEGDAVKELQPDRMGGFVGLSRPGQTFYFSRTLEALESPTLCLSPADRTFAVFLDGRLIYTDCPEQDNRIGYLRLPSLSYYREKPLLIPLPPDCAGKTLTVAQSTGPEAGGTASPCTVVLYGGYAYESGLIAESSQTSLSAALAFAAGVVLLAFFVWKSVRKGPDPTLACGALAAFLYEGSQILSPSFFYAYFDTPPIDVPMLCRELALMNLLGLLLCKLTGRRRVPVWAALGGMGASVLAELALSLMGQDGSFFRDTAFPLLGIAGLLCALAGGFWEWRRGSWFFRVFCPAVIAGAALAGLTAGAWPIRLWNQLALGAFGYFLWRLMALSMAPAFLGAVVELIHQEISARTEAHLLSQRTELALSSYQALLQHNEQVMMLRHDLAKHLRVLRQMTGEERVAAYLDGLIGQNEKIRPVVQSGNEMLDIILNSKLSAAGQGIDIKLIRVQAPERLALSDGEFCSLVTNLMDNAIEAASAPGIEHPYIKLDLYRKGHFFVFSCENSAAPDWIHRKPAPERGLGLKIVGQIAARHEDLLETEAGEDFYRVVLAIPLE